MVEGWKEKVQGIIFIEPLSFNITPENEEGQKYNECTMVQGRTTYIY